MRLRGQRPVMDGFRGAGLTLCVLFAFLVGAIGSTGRASAQLLLPQSVIDRLKDGAGGRFSVSDLLSNIKVDDFSEVALLDGAGSVTSGTLKIFNATIPATFNEGTDVLEFSIQGTSISFNDDIDNLDEFLEANADAILLAIFPNLDGGIMGTSSSQRSAIRFSETILLAPMDPPARRKERGKKDPREKDAEDIEKVRFVRRNLGGVFGFDRFTVGSANATGTTINGTLGFNEERERWEWGVLAPYSFTDSNDALNTTAHAFDLNVYLAYVAVREPVVLKAGVTALSNVTAFDTDLGLGGFIRYGGGPFVTTQKEFAPVTLGGSEWGPFSVGGTMGFQLSDMAIPIVKDELVNALEARDPDQEFFYGLRGGMVKGEYTAFNVGFLRLTNLSGDVRDDFDTATQLFATLSVYLTQTFELTLGYRKILEVKDLTSDGGFLGFLLRF